MKNKRILKKILITIICLFFTITVLVFIPPAVIIGLVTDRVDYNSSDADGRFYQASEFNIVSQDMMLKTDDDIEIFVSEVSCEKPRGVVIFLSGIRGPSVTCLYPQAKWLTEHNYSSFLIELRGHGKSNGNISLGCKETNDVRAVVDYINTKHIYDGIPITVIGFSMGGAVAINSIGSIKDIDGVIALSAYSSFEDVASDQILRCFGPKWLSKAANYSTKIWMNIFFGDDGIEMSPKEKIKKTDDKKVFLIAAQNDATVPSESIIRLAAASCGDTEIWIRNSSNHFIIENNDFLNFEDDELYCEKILCFLNSVENNN